MSPGLSIVMQPSPRHLDDPAVPGLPSDIRTEIERRIAAGRLDLPVLPHVVAQLFAEGFGESSDVAELSDLLHGDQALASHVLRVANSAAYAGTIRIQSIQQALLRIGLTQLHEIVLAVAMGSRVFQIDGFQNVIADLWKHAAVAAAYAKEIARHLRANTESAFLCGLLHDVGKPVVLSLMLDLRDAQGRRLSRELCVQALEPYHATVGSTLAARWALPESVATAIAYHHDFAAAADHATEARITCLANLLAHLVAVGSAADEAALRAHPVCAALNLYPDDVDALLAKRDAMLTLAEVLTA
jgi:putative nucleotidyltransferase with HDIG domain